MLLLKLNASTQICIHEIKISKHELREHGKHLALKHLDKIE